MQSPNRPGGPLGSNMIRPTGPMPMSSMQSLFRPGDPLGSNTIRPTGPMPMSMPLECTNKKTSPDKWIRDPSRTAGATEENGSPNKRVKPTEGQLLFQKGSSTSPNPQEKPKFSASAANSLINGDDSSDEESEKSQDSTSLVEQLYTTSLKVADNMQCSFTLLYLGVRILISKKVRKLYYSLKEEKLRYEVNLPCDQTLQDEFESNIKKAIEGTRNNFSSGRDELQEIQKSEAYSSYMLNVIQNKEQFLSSPLSYRFRNPEFETSYKELQDKLFETTKYFSVQNLVKLYHRRDCAISRPVLGDVYHFLIDEKEYNPAKFLANLRLDHCSTKRNLKNLANLRSNNYSTKKKLKNDIYFFVRNYWKFGSENDYVTIEKQTVLENCTGIKSKVLFGNIKGLDSNSYESLFKKIEELRQELRMTKARIVRNIRSLLKTGKLEYNNGDLEEFLSYFTYLLFGTESVRHPASLIYNVLALDLIENYDMQFSVDLFPMAQKGAMGSVRAIQKTLGKQLPIDYHYDYKDCFKDETMEEFQRREKHLVQTWIAWKLQIGAVKLDDWLKCKCSPLCKLQFVQEANKLCKEYYDIELL